MTNDTSKDDEIRSEAEKLSSMTIWQNGTLTEFDKARIGLQNGYQTALEMRDRQIKALIKEMDTWCSELAPGTVVAILGQVLWKLELLLTPKE